MLQAGQVIRYDDSLWRVDYANSCRARIVPLAKRTVSIDDRTFESEGRGVNISPNSFVEIVTDIEAARTRLELAAVEAELAELKQAAAAPPVAPRPAPRPVTARVACGWHVGPKPAPAFRDGSMGAAVMAWIVAHPGQTTAEIVAGVQHEGAVAACVSRFCQAGLIKKS
jgi:hypothetical protein